MHHIDALSPQQKATEARMTVTETIRYMELASSEQMAALFAALAEAQAEIGNAAKDSKNPHFNSKYADLASVWDAWQQVGPKRGLAVVQLVRETDRQGILLETVLTHKQGGYMASCAFFPAVKNDSQAMGSALTYARRYMLSALVGVCPDDDDGNAASGKSTPSKSAPSSPPADFVAKAEDALKRYANNPDRLKFIKGEAEKCNATDIAARAQAALDALEGKK